MALARLSPVYGERAVPRTARSIGPRSTPEPRARCTTSSSWFAAGRAPKLLVDEKRVPYAHELWLPLFWIFVGGEA